MAGNARRSLRVGLLVAAAVGFALYHWATGPGFSFVQGLPAAGVWTERPAGLGEAGLSWREAGAGPPVVVLHGFASDGRAWTGVARRLKGSHRVIAPDLTGSGARGNSYPELVERLGDFVQREGLKEFHLVGTSMGGAVAALYASRHPAEVRSLSLLAPDGAEGPRRSPLQEALARGDQPMVVRSAEDFDVLMGYLYASPPRLPTKIRDAAAAELIRQADPLARTFAALQADPARLPEALLEVDAPVLLLWGADDRANDPSGLAVLQRSLQKPRTTILQGCGHVLARECPDQTAEVLEAFLGDVERGRVP